MTEGRGRKRIPSLVYIFAEPTERNGHAIPPDDFARHRAELARFAKAVAGDEVVFHFASYRDWLGTWPTLDIGIAAHGRAVIEAFAP